MFNYRAFLPSTIFARFLVIIITPVIIAQLIAIYVFYERHWSNVSGYVIENFSNEILLITKLYQLDNGLETARQVNDSLSFKHFLKHKVFIKKEFNEDDELEDFFNNIVNKIHLPLNLNYNSNKNEIELEIAIKKDKVLTILASRKNIDNPTTYIFILWMTGTSTIFTILSILFLKNQVKSISKLATAAEKFGKGSKIENFKPSGAKEIKNAGKAFLKMKKRIERQIAQRTFMLSAVSHDLKTPITRIKLELEMIEQNSQILAIKGDVKELEKMINHYLDFARDDDGEFAQLVNIPILINSIIANYYHQHIKILFSYQDNFSVHVKEESFKRAFINLLDNALKYAYERVTINTYLNNKFLFIEISDDGQGIANKQKSLVFKPFYRTDSSRNNSNGGVGLGLAIAKDIINSHGGDIILEDNSPSGLKAIIKIPV